MQVEGTAERWYQNQQILSIIKDMKHAGLTLHDPVIFTRVTLWLLHAKTLPMYAIRFERRK